MKELQNDIYYNTGESMAAVSSSPVLEVSRKQDPDVTDRMDPIEDYGARQLKDFDGNKLKPTTEKGLDIDDADEKKNKRSSRPISTPMTSTTSASRMEEDW